MAHSPVPSYLLDSRTGRGFVRWSDRKTKKRRVKVFSGEFGSPESKAAYRIWVQQFDARVETSKIRTERQRIRDLSVAELCERWVEDYVERFGEKSGNTRNARAAALAACERHAATMCRDFTAGDLAAIRDLLVSRGRLVRDGVNRQIYAIRRMFKWGRERSIVPAEVVADLEVVRGVAMGRGLESSDPPTADPKAVDAIIADLEHRNPRAARIIGFLRWTGCRPSEAYRARVAWLDQEARRLVIPAQVSKTRRPRIIALNAPAIEILQAAIPDRGRINPGEIIFLSTKGKPYTASGILQAMTKTAKRIGVPPQTPYSLRRLAATEVLHATSSETEAAALLGHSTRSRIVERYTRDRASIADRAAQHVGGCSPSPRFGAPA
jgi:integrase